MVDTTGYTQKELEEAYAKNEKARKTMMGVCKNTGCVKQRQDGSSRCESCSEKYKNSSSH